jgi:2'-hydroxyisoflavone reductase
MSTDRREFLRLAGIVAGGTALSPEWLRADSPGRREPSAGRKLRILILGGTGFIGPHQVRYALDRGHDLALFNRGRTNPGLFPQVEHLQGDRAAKQLDALRGRKWDVVIDNSATDPAWVHDTALLLSDATDQYIFISTRSVYADTSRVPMTNAAPVFTAETAGWREGQPMPYGLRKALAEKEAHQALPGRVTIVRPGLIIGPGDDTDRFTYWPVRIERGGEVLAPGDGSDPVQIIDARDLSEWVIRLAEQRAYGVFNAVGPRVPRPFDELLYGIRAVTSAETTFTWVATDFLLERRVRPYSDLPVWMPARDGREGFARFDITPEVERGLTFRPLAVTVRDSLDYFHSLPAERQATLKAGLSPAREAELLAAWKAR